MACLFLWRVVFAGQVFVPARLLGYVAPWSANAAPENLPVWNPLMYDSVGQFTPWREYAARTIRDGRLPFWNPYQFCGTPFVANSQSAVFYPPNLLHLLMPKGRATGWLVLLHLVLTGIFMWLFLKSLGLSDIAGAIGGTAWAFSTWQTAWLQLPTFLSTSCWLPLVLLLARRLFTAEKRDGISILKRTVALGLAIGLTLLAGHLQIAFYVMLAASFTMLGYAVKGWRANRSAVVQGLACFAVAVILGAMLASPQLLPSIELSRRSHRVGAPTAQGYAAYIAYAVNPDDLAAIVLPDIFGNPSNLGLPYWGHSRDLHLFNYAEGALYAGLPTLILAVFAFRKSRRRKLVLAFGFLALLSLTMALGTAVDALLYFYVPGFGQSGSPGRILSLWTFAVAALAACGFDALMDRPDRNTSIQSKLSGLLTATLLPIALGAVLILLALRTGYNLGLEDASPYLAGGAKQAVLYLLSAVAIIAVRMGWTKRGWTMAVPVLLAVDLLAANARYNPTSKPEEVYPETRSIANIVRRVGHERIMPINANWSFGGPHAVLPPNGATMFGLRDVQGYDSLFPGQYKQFMNDLAGPGMDASPREVGNMVFAKNPESPLVGEMGVRFILSREALSLPGTVETNDDGFHQYEIVNAPGRATLSPHAEGAKMDWIDDGLNRVELRVDSPVNTTLTLADQFYPGWSASVDGRPVDIHRTNRVFRSIELDAGTHNAVFAFNPASIRVGLYLMLIVVALTAFTLSVAASDRLLNRSPSLRICPFP